MFLDKELSGMVEKFTSGLHLPGNEEESAYRQVKRKAMVKKILSILKEVDKDKSGSTEWDEFLEFFRKAECLLEYRSDHAQTRNRTVLHEEVEAMRRTMLAAPQLGKDVQNRASMIGRRASFRLA
ncbi:unnamed protein product [Effrenium voratum]|nr:unnamed protein product [Effrenium voratum]